MFASLEAKARDLSACDSFSACRVENEDSDLSIVMGKLKVKIEKVRWR